MAAIVTMARMDILKDYAKEKLSESTVALRLDIRLEAT